MWDDALIRERSPIYNIDKINVPIYTVASWQDEQVGPRAVNWFSKVRPEVPLYATVTNGDHGMYRTQPSLDDLNRFFDHYLKGVNNGYETTPRIRVWWEAGRDGARAPGWSTSIGQWPPSGTDVRRLYLDQGGALGTQTGTGGPDPYVYAGPTGQGIQNPRYSGVTTQPDQYLWPVKPAPGTSAAYTSQPLAQDTTVLGAGSLDLWLASTAPDTDLQVTLTEVRPDGQEEYVQAGWLRASHRKLRGPDAEHADPPLPNPPAGRPGAPHSGHTDADADRDLPVRPRLPRRLTDQGLGRSTEVPARAVGLRRPPAPGGQPRVPRRRPSRRHWPCPVLPGFAPPAADAALPACGTVIRQPCRPA